MAYARNKSITVDHTKVGSTDHTDFPMLFQEIVPDLKSVANGGSVTSSSGYDIVFSTGTSGSPRLDFELANWDAATGAITAWIRISSLSHTVDTVIYLVYGDASVTTDQSNKTGTWNSGFRFVHHMNESSGTTIADSTSHALSGTKTSSTKPLPNTLALIGTHSQEYTQSDGGYNIEVLDSTNPTALTISCWVQFKTTIAATGTQAMIFRTTSGGPPTYSHELGISTAKILAYMFDGSTHSLTGTTTMTSGIWYYLTMTCVNGGVMTAYLNAVSEGTPISIGTMWAGGDRWWSGPAISFEIGAYLEEIHYSTVVRSADWILASYNNQSSPSTFYTFTPGGGGGGGGSSQPIMMVIC